jgi:microcystin-dependent protein
MIKCGMGMIWYADTPPEHFLICNGEAISRSTYAALFALIGTKWGVGDGSTTFNLPKCPGRALIGAGTGEGLTPRTIGEQVGEEGHSQTFAELASHSHSLPNVYRQGTGYTLSLTPNAVGIGTETGASGSGNPANVMQPSLVVHFLIAYEDVADSPPAAQEVIWDSSQFESFLSILSEE